MKGIVSVDERSHMNATTRLAEVGLLDNALKRSRRPRGPWASGAPTESRR